jgi:tRNA pseudouridine38-40 synthase
MQAQDDGTAKTVWKLVLSYDGTDFHGWQIQPGSVTIQGALAEAIASVTGEQVLPQGSGRTDAGVHAWGQVASFPLGAAIPAENLLRALNRVLPATIRVRSAEVAPEGFHARHNAVGKVYQYRVFQGAMCSPFMTRYVAGCKWPLDMDAMQLAANIIIGEHDFTSFAATDPDRSTRLADENGGGDGGTCEEKPEAALSNNIRRIDISQWSREAALPFPGALESVQAGPERDSYGDSQTRETGAIEHAEILTYTVGGNGFLHHMVRNLVGTFVEVGRGSMAVDEVRRILEGRDRTLAGPTAAARGLCLMKVLY